MHSVFFRFILGCVLLSVSAAAQIAGPVFSPVDSEPPPESEIPLIPLLSEPQNQADEPELDEGFLFDDIAKVSTRMAAASLAQMSGSKSDRVYAWNAQKAQEGFKVVVLTKADHRITFMCTIDQKKTGAENPVACKELSKEKGTEQYEGVAKTSLGFVQAAQRVALEHMFYKANTLGIEVIDRDGQMVLVKQDLSTLTEVKVWSYQKEHADHDHDHDHGPDVWVKFSLLVDMKPTVFYIQCHTHAGSQKIRTHLFTAEKFAEANVFEPAKAFANEPVKQVK